MSKPRVIIPISLQFSVRYLVRTGLLDRLKDSCEPVLLLGWSNTELEQELGKMAEVHSLPKSRWGGLYERARGLLNARHSRVMSSPSTRIRERRANLERRLPERLQRGVKLASRETISSLPGVPKVLRRIETDLVWKDTNAREVQTLLRRLRADSLFCLTPFLQDEELVARVCSLDGMPTCAAILSFDNLTTRGWIPVTFDRYLLWNRHNQDQLHRGYPETRGQVVNIVGSPQFDFYWKPEYFWSESQWRQTLGLPPSRPVVLFGGGYYSCAPHEPQFLAHLDEAIDKGEIPGNPLLLFRRHPVDPLDRWEPVLKQAKHVVHDDPWKLGAKILGHTNIQTHDIAKLASTLYHTVAHVNVASTMSIDGAILDRPQVGPAYDESPARKYHRSAYECYQQEHFLPILQSGGVAVARSREELVKSLRQAISEPGQHHAGRTRLVEEICTFSDGQSTKRVAAAVTEFLGRKAVAAVSAGQEKARIS